MPRILGIDLGDARTGIALSDPGELIASGLCTLTEYSAERLIEKICALIKEREVSEVVIGLPVNMDGTHGPRALKVTVFAKLLSEKSGMNVRFYDERCSTMVAHRILNETDRRGRKRKQVIDTLSAEIILQDYLDRKRRAVL